MEDLFELKKWLVSRVNSDTELSFLNTRLILRTGVDLMRIQEATVDPQNASAVRMALLAMGYRPGESG